MFLAALCPLAQFLCTRPSRALQTHQGRHWESLGGLVGTGLCREGATGLVQDADAEEKGRCIRPRTWEMPREVQAGI